MKRSGLWLLVVLPLLSGAVDVEAQSVAVGLYAEGNVLYRAGDFAAARVRYEAAIASGVNDPRLLYNLGNATYKTGDLGLAIVWYERALRLTPRDADVHANLRFLRRIKRDSDPPPMAGLGGAIEAFYLWPTVDALAWCWALSLVILFVVASWRRWQGVDGPRRSVILVAVGCLVIGLFAASRFQLAETRSEAVVTVDEGIARSGPDAGETEVFVIHEGTKVVVERSEGRWHLVRLSSGLGGWLPESVVTVI